MNLHKEISQNFMRRSLAKTPYFFRLTLKLLERSLNRNAFDLTNLKLELIRPLLLIDLILYLAQLFKLTNVPNSPDILTLQIVQKLGSCLLGIFLLANVVDELLHRVLLLKVMTVRPKLLRVILNQVYFQIFRTSNPKILVKGAIILPPQNKFYHPQERIHNIGGGILVLLVSFILKYS